jgi:hypothetical protein
MSAEPLDRPPGYRFAAKCLLLALATVAFAAMAWSVWRPKPLEPLPVAAHAGSSAGEPPAAAPIEAADDLVAPAGAAAPADRDSPAPGPRPGGHATDPRVTALIDRLTEVSEQGVGSHATAWAGGFVAVDEEFRFHGGIFGSKKPVTHPAMRELVRSGVAALPDLLDHLTDARPTKLVVEHKTPFGGMWHGNEYDPRDPARPPAGVDTAAGLSGWGGHLDEYTVKVGDLCFVAVGQIVNRGLSVLRYQPSACLVINSPVQTPALAAATRKDWSGLTAEQHRQSLTKDALGGSRWGACGALPRLLFYYPAAGEEVALKVLKVPSLTAREGTYEATDLVQSLAGINNDKVDGAVLALFRSIDLEKFHGSDRVVADSLALACMERLAGKGLDDEFAAYCEGRIRELKGRKREIAEEQRLEFLTEMLRRLRPK